MATRTWFPVSRHTVHLGNGRLGQVSLVGRGNLPLYQDATSAIFVSSIGKTGPDLHLNACCSGQDHLPDKSEWIRNRHPLLWHCRPKSSSPQTANPLSAAIIVSPKYGSRKTHLQAGVQVLISLKNLRTHGQHTSGKASEVL